MTSTTTFEDTSLDDLRAALTGDLALPGEPGYELAVPWNVAVALAPRAVVLARDAGDITAAVRFAAGHGLRVAVQRTGHGAVALDGEYLLVHTARLDECTVDPATRTARVGAGVVWQTVIDAAAPHGLAPLAGSAPGVGVVGFLTGGGIGPFVRTYGASSDWVTAFDVVTGDGRLLRATPEEHAELFWGLRGGKATLGIVTAVEFSMPSLSGFHGGALYFDGSDAHTILHAWREWAPSLPESANTSIALLQLPPLPMVPPPLAGKLTVALRFTTIKDDGEQLLAPIRALGITPLIDAIGPMPYAAVGAVHADPVDPMPTAENHALLRELPAAAVDALLAVAGPGAPSPEVIVELRLLGGALARKPEHASAFCRRDAAFSLLVIGVLAPEIAAIVPAHQAAVVGAVEAWSTGGLLPNFAPSADPARMAKSYDEDTVHWLRALGDQYDPAGVLRVGQVMR